MATRKRTTPKKRNATQKSGPRAKTRAKAGTKARTMTAAASRARAQAARAASKTKKTIKTNKTVPTGADPGRFVDAIKDPAQREDSRTLLGLMSRATNATPRMWGGTIVGFGSYRYKYDSGREGEWCVTGFSPRKGMTTVYILPGLDRHEENLRQLGKVTTGKSCIYIKRLSDIDLPTLEAMVKQATIDIRAFTPAVDMS